MSYPADRVERIAKAAYAATTVWHDPDTKFVPWDKAEEGVREQYIADINTILNTPFANNAVLHNAWMVEMTSTDSRVQPDGPWKYGKVFDEGARTHPEIAPFHQLPPDKQATHRLIVVVAQALAQV